MTTTRKQPYLMQMDMQMEEENEDEDSVTGYEACQT